MIMILQTPKDAIRYISKKCRFPLAFHKQHGKSAQKLFKCARRHLYHIYGSLERILSLKKSLIVI